MAQKYLLNLYSKKLYFSKFLLSIAVTICLIQESKSTFCGTFPALAKTRKFNRDRVEKSDGTFDFKSRSYLQIFFKKLISNIANGYQHSIFGWFRITDSSKTKNTYELL